MQSRKAETPIEVTELGIVTEVKPMQPYKAPLPIEVTELGIVKSVTVYGTKYSEVLSSS